LLEDGDIGIGVFPVKSQTGGLDNQGRNTPRAQTTKAFVVRAPLQSFAAA